jgi:CRP-like cAMP-binding protein
VRRPDDGTTADARPRLGVIERALILKAFPGFAPLSMDQLTVLATIARERFFPAGTVMHTPGRIVTCFHMILEGLVEVHRHGRRAQELGPKGLVGGLAALTRDPEGSHIVAVRDTFALEIDSEDMDDLWEEHFSLIRSVLLAMSRTLRAAVIKGGEPQEPSPPPEAATSPPPSAPLSLIDRMFALRGASSFAAMSLEAVGQLAADTEELRLQPGETLWKVDDPSRFATLVVHGVAVCSPPGGATFRVGPGSHVGAFDVMAEQPRWFECRAETAVVALRMSGGSILDVLEDHPEVAVHMLRDTARRLNRVFDRLAERGIEAT